MGKITYAVKALALWKKQKRRIDNLRKRGYLIEDIKPLPKHINKKVYERLEKSLTLEKLYESNKNFYIYTNLDGEQKMVSAKRGREIERERKAQKAAITRKQKRKGIIVGSKLEWDSAVIAGVRNQIASYTNYLTESFAYILNEILDNAIENYGFKETASRIYIQESRAKFLIEEILKPSPSQKNEVYVKINEFAELIKGENLTVEQRRYFERYYNELDEFDNL